MIGYFILLLACANVIYGESPPYFESYQKLNFTKRYFATRLLPLPPRPDINDDEDRRHLSFAILAQVTGAEVLRLYVGSKSTALEVASKNIPYAWSNYNEVSRQASGLLKEVTTVVKPVTDLIESCRSVRFQCNDLVEKKRRENPKVYQKPASVLLSIGDSVTAFKNNINLIESLTGRSREIPYLLNNVNSPQYERFVNQLLRTYRVLKGILNK